MKKLLTIILILGSLQSFGQMTKFKNYEPYLVRNMSDIIFRSSFTTPPLPFYNVSSFYYWPQKANGLQVINVRRQGTNMDDVYYVDKYGVTQHQTIMQTKPVNLMNINNRGADSMNPSGATSFGEALFQGAATLIFQNLDD